jgi:hypothetical protein
VEFSSDIDKQDVARQSPPQRGQGNDVGHGPHPVHEGHAKRRHAAGEQIKEKNLRSNIGLFAEQKFCTTGDVARIQTCLYLYRIINVSLLPIKLPKPILFDDL